jgi:hypothetical protein
MTAILVLVGLVVLAIATTSLIGPYASPENQNVSSINVTSADTNVLYNLTIGEKPYPVIFIIRGGVLDGMSIDGDQAILLASINASENGGLRIDLPRNLIDSKTTSDIDKSF